LTAIREHQREIGRQDERDLDVGADQAADMPVISVMSPFTSGGAVFSAC
jgi:hypothetical protein